MEFKNPLTLEQLRSLNVSFEQASIIAGNSLEPKECYKCSDTELRTLFKHITKRILSEAIAREMYFRNKDRTIQLDLFELN